MSERQPLREGLQSQGTMLQQAILGKPWEKTGQRIDLTQDAGKELWLYSHGGGLI